MRIKMLETRRGTEDGFTVREYARGKEYELAPTERGEELGIVFMREGWAEAIAGIPAEAPKAGPGPLVAGSPPDPRSPEALKMIGATPERVAALAKEDAKISASPPASAAPARGSRKGQ